MFDWLKGKEKLDNAWARKEYPSKFNPVAMPSSSSNTKMPDVYYAPNPVKPSNISEPVVTLLKMLERDEWEVDGKFVYYSEEYVLTNIFNEKVKIRVRKSYTSFDETPRKLHVYLPWINSDEQIALDKAVEKVIAGNHVVMDKHGQELARYRFAKLINVEVTNGN